MRWFFIFAFLTAAAAAQSTVSPAEFLCTADSLLIVNGPGNLSEGLHSVNLTWTNSGTVFWNRVYRGTVSGGPYTLLADCVTSASYTDPTVGDGGLYYYVVTTVNQLGESGYSNQTSAQIPVFDTLLTATGGYATPAETLSTVDSIAARIGNPVALAETVTTSDALAAAIAGQAALAESLTTSDSIAASNPVAKSVSLAESLTTSAAIVGQVAGDPALSESLSTSDSLLAIGGGHAGIGGAGTISGQGIVSSGPGVIPATLFGLHFRFNELSALYGQPPPPVVLLYPNLPFGALRLWDTDTRWQNLEQAQGVYNFAAIDPYLQIAKARGVQEVVFTLSSTPTWASSIPSANYCDYSFFTLGDCAPPSDLNADGTGADQYWRDFIYNLSAHLKALGPAYHPVTAFEMWNEFTRGPGGATCTESTSPESWTGTCAQLVRMAQDANCILTGRAMTITATGTGCTPATMHEPAVGLQSQAKIFTPDAGMQLPDFVVWGTYLATAGAMTGVDGMAVHIYAYQGLGTTLPDSTAVNNNAASVPQQWANTIGELPGSAFGLPIWSTEGSWGSTPNNLPDANMDEGYVARYYLVGWSAGFRRLYWYAVNNSYGTLINQNGINGCNDGGTKLGCPTLAATGWTAVYNWMVGSTMTTAAAPDASGNIWTTGLVTPGGTAELAVWDASQTCTPCTYSTYSYPAGFVKYYTLDSGTTSFPLTGGTVQIGWKPILLSQ